MTASFWLICTGRTLCAWQADAIRLLLAEGLRLTQVLSSPVTLLRRSCRRVPLEAIVPPGTTVKESAGKSIISTEADRQTPDFAICCLPVDHLPELGVDPPYGLWFWQFGRQAPGGVTHLAVDELTRGSRTLLSRLMAWHPQPRQSRVLYQGRFRIAQHSLALTRRRVLSSCAEWPRRAWREFGTRPERIVQLDRWVPPPPPSVKTGRLGGVRLTMALLRGTIKRAFEELLLEEKWTLGVLKRPVGSLLSKPSVDDALWLKELPGGDYLTDPMGLPDRGRWILAEYYDAGRGTGSIAAIDLEHTDHFKVVLAEDGHLSYPQLLVVDQDHYCIPERAASGQVTLYRATAFPDGWERVAILLSDVAGADCTVFHHDGLWWMLGADHADQDTVKLFGWFAPHLTGPWQAHALNPLKTDVCGARPAGSLFYHDGQLYRPAQDCSAAYGGAVVIHRIVALAPDRFREEQVARIEPVAASRYPKGVHTICAAGQRTVVDAKRHYLSLGKVMRTLAKYWRKARPKAPGGQTPCRHRENP